MNLAALQLKTDIIRAIRLFFEQQGFQEIFTPVLHETLPLEPNLFAFETQWQNTRPLYLSISPESSLKKMMAAGVTECFSISSCFRNLEASGPQHTPEFLMLEWYRPNATYETIMSETEALIEFTQKKLKLPITNLPWPRLSLIDLFNTHAGIDLTKYLDNSLLEIAKTKGYSIENATWSAIFDQIFLNEVELHLPSQPFFLTDFPSRISPLCKPQPMQPAFAERFEVYMNHMEIGNGNTENLDRTKVKKTFMTEKSFRINHKLPSAAIDQDFLSSLAKLNKKYDSVAGIGLGIDRLAMILAQASTIQEVEPLNVC